MRRAQLILGILIVMAVSPATGGRIYWTDGDLIQRAQLDGSDEEILRRNPPYPGGLTLDVARGTLYWHDKQDVFRSRLDGSHMGRVLDLCGCRKFVGLGLDPVARYLYWMESGVPGPGGTAVYSHLYRLQLDTAQVDWVVSWESAEVMDFVIDVPGQKIYWSEDTGFRQPASAIYRMNLDGTDVETVIDDTDGVQITCIGIDEIERRLYWGAGEPGSESSGVIRSDLDGSGIEEIVTGVTSPILGIALDPSGRKLYWSDHLGQEGSGRIRRSSTDGSDIEDVLTGCELPADLTVDPRANEIQPRHAIPRRLDRRNPIVVSPRTR